MAVHPLRSATDRRLGGPSPRQLTNRTQAHPSPFPLAPRACAPKASWGLNPGFPRLSPSEGQVAYALLTRPPLSAIVFRRNFRRWLLARLACVRRAASVHPEPGSNSHFLSIRTLFRGFRSFSLRVSFSLVSRFRVFSIPFSKSSLFLRLFFGNCRKRSHEPLPICMIVSRLPEASPPPFDFVSTLWIFQGASLSSSERVTSYHLRRSLSTPFFLFFRVFFGSGFFSPRRRPSRPTACPYYQTFPLLSIPFFHLFRFFSLFSIILPNILVRLPLISALFALLEQITGCLNRKKTFIKVLLQPLNFRSTIFHHANQLTNHKSP